jgi:hypothetical protein
MLIKTGSFVGLFYICDRMHGVRIKIRIKVSSVFPQTLVVFLFSKVSIPRVSFCYFHHVIDRYRFTVLSCLQCRQHANSSHNETHPLAATHCTRLFHKILQIFAPVMLNSDDGFRLSCNLILLTNISYPLYTQTVPILV